MRSHAPKQSTRHVFCVLAALLFTVRGQEGAAELLRREPGRRKHRSWGLLELTVDSIGGLKGIQDNADDACDLLCRAIDVTTVSKKCVDLSNEECASASFYETLDNGDRRPCALKPAAGSSLSDPNAENCEVDNKRTCKKGKVLCPEGTADADSAAHEASKTSAAATKAAMEDCNLCAGRGDFLPSATAFMEDGEPFTCQYASDRIRSGDSPMSCAEAANELVDCCSAATSPSEPASDSDSSDCELCLGFGTLNSSEIAMIIAGTDPMSCSEAEENLKKGLAPISCESARRSELVSRCCIPDTTENCSLCSDGERLEDAMEFGDEMSSCREMEEQLQNQERSCNDVSLAHWRSQCCRCDLCDGRDFLPDALAEGDLRCEDATLRRGNGSMPCTEAKRRWSGSCCRPPVTHGDSTAATEAEAHGEKATPFCKSLCLKTDVAEWNMTCQDMQKDECISTHFFQTTGSCERRLCIWTTAEGTCSVDSTQACLDCNWPCGRKATTTTTTTSTSTTTTTTTTSTTTTFTTTVLGATAVASSVSGSGDEGSYFVHGQEVPSRCFEFCARTDVRSMYLTCDQLSETQCSSGNFYQTDVAGNRRYCRLEDECVVDDSFVCNATMPICRVPIEEEDASAPPVMDDLSTTSSGPDAGADAGDEQSGTTSESARRDEEMEVEAVLESIEAAARECLASGTTEQEIWQIYETSTGSTASLTLASPADRALKKALSVAVLFGVPAAQLAQALRRAGVAWSLQGDSEICSSLCSKYEVANCSTLSMEFCRSNTFYQSIAESSGFTARKCEVGGEESCTSGKSFFCNSTCSDRNGTAPDLPPGHETFCRSLCSKTKVMNCSHLSVQSCEEYFAEDPQDGFVLCQEDHGRCIDRVAAAVSSVRCDLPRLCGSGANATVEIAPESSTTSAPRSTTTPKEEINLFSGSCSENCPEVSAELCDSDWKQTGQCSCQCKKYRPHIVMLLVNSLGFNDFVDSSDLSTGWPFLKSVLPKAIRINTSYVELGSAPSRAAFLTGRWPRHLTWATAPSMSGDEAAGAQGWSPSGVSRHRQLGSTTGAFAQAGEHTIAEKLNDAGYKSYAIGKWQAGGVSWKMTPGGRGFSRFFGSYDDASDYVKHCDMQGHYDLHYEETEHFEANGSWRFHRPYHYYPSGKDVVGKHVNSLFQEKAKQFIVDHKAKYGKKNVPMFLYYAPMSFQEPLQAPQWTAANCTFEEGFASAANSNRQTFCRMATSLDRSIQKVVHTMKGAFLGDNWIVVVASDSGGSASHKGSGGSNWPLRGSRGEVWEGGIRTKALLFGSHPELDAAQSLNHTYSGGFLHLIDWHAILLRVAHATPNSLTPPDDMNGVSMWRAILDDLPSPRTELISNATALGLGTEGVAFRSGDLKLVMAPAAGKNPVTGERQGFRWPLRVIGNTEYWSVYDMESGGGSGVVFGSNWTWHGANWKLYNIRTDPSETVDLAQQLPLEVKRLENRLAQLLEKGRSTSGDSLLPKSQEIVAKAMQVLKSHSGEIQLNECPIKEGAYPFWEEAADLARLSP